MNTKENVRSQEKALLCCVAPSLAECWVTHAQTLRVPLLGAKVLNKIEHKKTDVLVQLCKENYLIKQRKQCSSQKKINSEFLQFKYAIQKVCLHVTEENGKDERTNQVWPERNRCWNSMTNIFKWVLNTAPWSKTTFFNAWKISADTHGKPQEKKF